MAYRAARTAEAPAPAPDFAWSHPAAGLRAAAFGEQERREGSSLREVLARLEGGPWFGAAAFDPSQPCWNGFPAMRFVRPARLIWNEPAPPPARPAAAHVVQRPGERERWSALVRRALAEIEGGSLDKVVLARAIEVEADEEIDCAALLRALESRYPACRTFLVRGEGAVFLGATPELLCRVEGGRVFAEAVAGSSRPGEGDGLLASRKDLREHRWVVDHMLRALSGVAEEVRCPPDPLVRELANIAHLHTPIEARLLPGRGIADVAAALHPTPAVLGVPGDAALRFLRAHEQLDRGLYAGLVGWISPERSDLAVALRCALVRGRRARLFVGAGIVEGSSPEAEWEETELKARALLEALGA
jgi:isochorismate synthase